MSVESKLTYASPEAVQPTLNAVLVHMVGEGRIDLQEPISIEILGTHLEQRVEGCNVDLLDTQADIVTNGRVDIEKIADFIRKKGSNPQIPLLIGISVPIYAWENAKSLGYRLRENPPASPYKIVIGNSIATYVNNKTLHEQFPEVVIVKGEGEDHLIAIAHHMVAGIDTPTVYEPKLVNLNRYLVPNRKLAQEVFNGGGQIRIEASRGCDHGACTFCARCFQAGTDYRTIPAVTVIEDFAQTGQFEGLRSIGLTDEEGFCDLKATREFIEVFKSSGLNTIPMHVSMRNDNVIKLEEAGLLKDLVDIGVKVFFLGSEGGSNSYLGKIGKGNSIENVRKSLEILKKYPVEVENGFITFHWRQTMTELRENILFLEENDHYKDISDTMNRMHVRSGSTEETIMNIMVKRGKIDYDPLANFSINRSEYMSVPFIYPEVEAIYDAAIKYHEEKRPLFYNIRALTRSHSLPADMEQKMIAIRDNLKLLDVKYMKHLVGLEHDDSLMSKRKALAQECLDILGTQVTGTIRDMVIREAKIFLHEEHLREVNENDSQVGAFLVLRRNNHVLITREINDDVWGFPGGGVGSEEALELAALREVREETGIDPVHIRINQELYVHEKRNHFDKTNGNGSVGLKLHFYEAELLGLGDVDLSKADYEVADALWVRLKDLDSGIFKMKEAIIPMLNKLKNLPNSNEAH